MRAAILTELNHPLTVDEIQYNYPLGVGQVRVQMQYAAICGSQINEIVGTKGPDKYLPHLLGHEGVGTVLEIGPGVRTKRVGDRVICHWRPSEGIAAGGMHYNWLGEAVQAGPMACFATECIVSENRLTICPHDLDPRFAPLFGCALTTAYGVVTRDAQVRLGETVCVIGAGGVGLACIQIASLAGAIGIDAIEPRQSKWKMAHACGATNVWFAEGNRWPHVHGYDVIIETTGRSDMIEWAHRSSGRVILVGVPRYDDPITIHSLPLHFGKVLKGSHGGDAVPHEDIPRLARLVRVGNLKLDGLITHEFQLEQINEALDLVRSGEAGRVILNCGS